MTERNIHRLPTRHSSCIDVVVGVVLELVRLVVGGGGLRRLYPTTTRSTVAILVDPERRPHSARHDARVASRGSEHGEDDVVRQKRTTFVT